MLSACLATTLKNPMAVCITGTKMGTDHHSVTGFELFPLSVTLPHLLVWFLFVAVPAGPVLLISNIVTHWTMASLRMKSPTRSAHFRKVVIPVGKSQVCRT
jgi:hypothetical protein